MTTELKNAARAIDEARRNVGKADLAYQHGASCDVVNKANEKLAAAHARFNEIVGLRVPDDR